MPERKAQKGIKLPFIEDKDPGKSLASNMELKQGSPPRLDVPNESFSNKATIDVWPDPDAVFELKTYLETIGELPVSFNRDISTYICSLAARAI